MAETGFWKGVVCGGAAVAAIAFGAGLVVGEQRDELADRLQLEHVRLEEARKLCRQDKVSCSAIGTGSNLVACRVPGSKFFWLAVESAAAGDL